MGGDHINISPLVKHCSTGNVYTI